MHLDIQAINNPQGSQLNQLGPADCGLKEIGQGLKEIHLQSRTGMKIRKQWLGIGTAILTTDASFSNRL